MISVILSNYNGEKFLRDALESVVNQDYDEYEFIVVDDGSSDDSKGIISDFGEKYSPLVRPFLETENRGQAEGFNKGVSEARGDLVCFIDSDDLWLPDKLKKLIAFRDFVGSAAFYQHNMYILRDGEQTNETYRDSLSTGDVFGYTKRMKRWPTFVATSGLAFERRILEKVMPIPSQFRTCADGYLTRTAYCHGMVASVFSCWGCYRVHTGNLTYESKKHDPVHFQKEILIPALNRYYEGIGTDFRFPTSDKASKTKAGWTDLSWRRPSKMIRKILETSPMDVIKRVERSMKE